MSRLADVAEVAGVSVATASRVLNQGKHVERISEACKAKVYAAAQQVGYAANYHAQVMKRGQAQTIAVAMEISGPSEDRSPEALTCNPYFMNLIAGIETATHKVGFALTLMGPADKELAINRVAEGIREKRFDGGVLLASVLTAEKTDLLTQAPDLPLVVVQPTVPTQLPVINFDDAKGIDLAVEHLASLGHRHVAWLSPLQHDGTIYPREQHFMKAIWDRGMTGCSLRFEYPPFEETNDPEAEIFNRAHDTMHRIMTGKHQPFTAVVCYNDPSAAGCMQALQELNYRIPHDISITGFDNTHARFCYPPLTTIDHQFAQMGLTAGQQLLEMIQKGRKSFTQFRGKQTIIQPKLIIRQSTGPAPTPGS